MVLDNHFTGKYQDFNVYNCTFAGWYYSHMVKQLPSICPLCGLLFLKMSG